MIISQRLGFSHTFLEYKLTRKSKACTTPSTVEELVHLVLVSEKNGGSMSLMEKLFRVTLYFLCVETEFVADTV